MPGKDMCRQAITDAALALRSVSDTARLDAELLMAHALGVSREALLLRHLDDAVPPSFAELRARRERHEPIAYITGSRAFWTIELAVGPGVLVPRADSETLIEAAVNIFGAAGPARILDLGTGPGTLLLAALAEWPQASGTGVDQSPVALDYARRNAEALGLSGRAKFIENDWGRGVNGPFDLILCNPPYIADSDTLPADVRDHEPALALFAGAEGLDAYRVIIPDLRRLLDANGVVILEIGEGQAGAITDLACEAGFAVSGRADLGGHVRALILSSDAK